MSDNAISRRSFVSVAGAAGFATAAAAAAGSIAPAVAEETAALPFRMTAEDYAESAAEFAPIENIADEKTYDIVVVGAGTSGIPAVLTALEEGCTVACLEKQGFAVSQGNGCTGLILSACTPLGKHRGPAGCRPRG